MYKKIIKFDGKIEEFEFHQHKSSISMNNINEIVVSNSRLSLSKIFNISLITKTIRKFDVYAYSFQKGVYIKDILIKINISIF